MANSGLRRRLPAAAATAILSAAAVSGMAAVSAAAGSSQSQHRVPYTVSAVTRLTAQGGGRAGPAWALESFSRNAWVTFRGSAPPSYCGVASGRCYAYTASLYDSGTFTTVRGQLSPNHAGYPGALITHQVRGQFHGYGLFMTFFATSRPQPGLVPSSVRGNIYRSFIWPELFFPPSTAFAGVNENDYGYYYRALRTQRWVDGSFNGDGQLASDGNITG